MNQRLHEIEDGVLAAHRDHAFGGRVFGAVIVVVAVADRLLQLQRPAGGRVLGEVGIDGGDGGLLDVVGRREVGLARAEIDDVDAFAAKPVGIGGDFHRRRFADERDPFG